MSKFLTAAFLLFTIVSYGQTTGKMHKSKEQIDKVCDLFMQNINDGKIPEAIDLLKQNSILGMSTLDTLQAKMQKQMRDIVIPQYGKIVSTEFIKEGKIKDFIAKRFYIIKLSDFYLKADFTLYNSGDGWTITSFHYNENIEELFTD